LVTGESILAVFSSKFSIVAVFFVRSILPIGVVCSWQCRRQQITPGEQTDHGIFGNFVQIDVGSNDGSHGSGDRLSPEFSVGRSRVGRLLICGFGKIVCEAFRLEMNFSSDA